MTLDEAIKHCEDVEQEKRYEYQECLAVYDIENAEECGRCGEEHRQLAEWLKDYKRLLEQEPCDAISRDMALEKMADYAASGYADSAEDFEEYSRIICQLPSVTQKLETVTEFADRCRECGKMRKGHWIWNFDKGYCKCSECGIGMGHKEFDYCPNCGAKMQESEE